MSEATNELVQRAPSAMSMASTGGFEVKFDSLSPAIGSHTNSISTLSTNPIAPVLSPTSSTSSDAPVTTVPIAASIQPQLSSSPDSAFSFQQNPRLSPDSMPSPSPSSSRSNFDPSTSPSNQGDGLFSPGGGGAFETHTVESEQSLDGSEASSALTNTAQFLPSPSTRTATTPLSTKKAPPPLRHDEEEDPFQQHGAAAAQQQQRTLHANSFHIDQPVNESASFAATRVGRPFRPHETQEEQKEQLQQSYAATLPRAYPNPSSSFSSTSTAGMISSLSSLPSSALRSKVRAIAELISQFDAQFLQRDAYGHEVYPAWSIPFVEEMAKKMETILRAQHEAEVNEEREQDLRRSTRFDESEREARQNERIREALASKEKVRGIERMKLENMTSSSSSGNKYYPEDLYVVDMNSELPFLKDHGSFKQRRAGVNTQESSPRRNLHGQVLDHTQPYTSGATTSRGRRTQDSDHQHQHQHELSQSARSATTGRRQRPVSAKSREYLMSLLGHDIGASTFNRIIRGTSRSPTRRVVQSQPTPTPLSPTKNTPVKELPGPTIPKAMRFSPNTPLSPTSPSFRRTPKSSPASSRREREMELELAALKLKVAELMEGMESSHHHRSHHHHHRHGHTPAKPNFDEDELAAALIRIGESNREKFLLLVSQITTLQQLMLQQQEKMNAMASNSNSNTQRAPSEQDHALTEEMRSQLEKLQRDLQESLNEKEKLTKQLREMASYQEKNKYALLEKLGTVSIETSDLAKQREQDRLLLKTYEEDLSSSRAAILQLQQMVQREADHARAFKADKEDLQQRFNSLTQLLHDRQAHERSEAYKSGRASLKPAERFKSFMHKYLASHYRKEFQNLLAEKSKTAEQVRRVEEEIHRAKEKHELELKYTHQTHESVLKHISSTLQNKEGMQVELQERLEDALWKVEQLQQERDEHEQNLLATEMLNSQLASELGKGAAAAPTTPELEFTTLMTASFKGDYLRLRNDTKILKLIYELGDEEILFSDYVQRIDRNNKHQKRILIITNAHMLCLWADRGRQVRRVIKIMSIHHITLSRQSADMFVVHYEDEYDYLILSSKRSEIMYHLLAITTRLSHGAKQLAYKFGERVYVRDRDSKYRDILVDEEKLILGTSTIRPPNAYDDRGLHEHGHY